MPKKNTTMLTRFIFVALACTACGSSPTVSSPVPTGSASNSNTTPAPVGVTPTTPAASSSAGTASSKGTVQGNSLSPKSAAYAPFENDGDYLLLVLSNQTDYCAATTASQTHANHRSLVGIFFTVDADGKSSQAIDTGTYTVSSEAPTTPGLYANAIFNASDASCDSTIMDGAGSATSGTLTLTAVTATSVSGSYKLQFTNDTLTGTFTAPLCAAIAAQASSGADLTCMP